MPLIQSQRTMSADDREQDGIMSQSFEYHWLNKSLEDLLHMWQNIGRKIELCLHQPLSERIVIRSVPSMTKDEKEELYKPMDVILVVRDDDDGRWQRTIRRRESRIRVPMSEQILKGSGESMIHHPYTISDRAWERKDETGFRIPLGEWKRTGWR